MFFGLNVIATTNAVVNTTIVLINMNVNTPCKLTVATVKASVPPTAKRSRQKPDIMRRLLWNFFVYYFNWVSITRAN